MLCSTSVALCPPLDGVLRGLANEGALELVPTLGRLAWRRSGRLHLIVNTCLLVDQLVILLFFDQC